jgi:hypothetical protein
MKTVLTVITLISLARNVEEGFYFFRPPFLSFFNHSLNVQTMIMFLRACSTVRISRAIIMIHAGLMCAFAGMGLLWRLIVRTGLQMPIMLHACTALHPLNY